MATETLFERFRDLVIARVPVLAADVAQRTLERLQGSALSNAVAADRQHTASVLVLLRPGSHGLAAAFSAALRQQLRPEFERAIAEGNGERQVAALPSIDQLTLVDDQQIEEDIEIARVIQRVDAAAELEWRELQSLCATLRGASAAAAELVPMRPEVCARALSRALHTLALSREARLFALREVGGSLATHLESLVREQARELRRWGVEPLPYQLRIAPDLHAATGGRDDSAMQRLAGKVQGDAGAAEQLIPKLLAQVADQAALDAGLRALLQRLAGPAMRGAGRGGAGVLSSFQHPVWRLVDRIATIASVRAGRGADASAQLARQLEPVVARLERGAGTSAAAYEQALADVDALATDWADSQLASAGVALVEPEAEPGSLPTDWGGEGSLPTVPMELAQPGTDPHQIWLDGLREGDLLRLFLHASWLTTRLAGSSSGHLLLATRLGAPMQALSRAALYRLHASGLATTIETAAPVRLAVDTLTLELE